MVLAVVMAVDMMLVDTCAVLTRPLVTFNSPSILFTPPAITRRGPFNTSSNPFVTFNLPFVMSIPPLALSVDTFRVDGMLNEAGGYAAPFMLERLTLAVLMVVVLRKDALTPPFRVVRPDTCSVFVAPTGPLNIAPGACTTRPPTANV
jgi:hypothetical protein